VTLDVQRHASVTLDDAAASVKLAAHSSSGVRLASRSRRNLPGNKPAPGWVKRSRLNFWRTDG
jgi:hypothetical protein